MSTLSATLSGTLSLRVGDKLAAGNTSGGCSMALALREPNQAAGGEISQQTAKTAGGGFVSLPFPANIRGKVFYLRMSTTTPIQIRITQEASGASVIPNVLGSILVEYDVADRVTGVEIDGAATFEWVVFGDSI